MMPNVFRRGRRERWSASGDHLSRIEVGGRSTGGPSSSTIEARENVPEGVDGGVGRGGWLVG